MSTIFALATPRGKSGVAIIRLSGPEAFSSASGLCGPLPASHQAKLRKIRDRQGNLLDAALVLSFAGPHSFTGEDVVELHLHGSTAIINSVLGQLAQMPGLRLAEPGEFTRRALQNNRLDLAQVEGLADLIESETEAQRKQALRVFSGALGEKVTRWRNMAIRAAALLEASIDFADEEVPENVYGEVEELIGQLQAELHRESQGSLVSERIRDGFEVAIVGPPNVGKSTLLNRLAGRDAAITSEIAGTTRDVLEVRMDLGGLPVTFLDTAGLRETDDTIESIGIARAIERANAADLRVFLHQDTGAHLLAKKDGDIVLRAKGDLNPGQQKGSISGLTGQGVDELVAHITKTLEARSAGASTIIRARQRQAIDRAGTALSQALSMVQAGADTAELSAEELRTAIRALDSLIGRVDVEDLLDEIFASFCLGK